jgi:hypothetical protein
MGMNASSGCRNFASIKFNTLTLKLPAISKTKPQKRIAGGIGLRHIPQI